MRPELTPWLTRKLRTETARLAPSAILYSRVPRSSACPSMLTVWLWYCCSQRAWAISACCASGVSKEVRAQSSKAYAMLNDSEHEPSLAVLDAMKNYGVEPIRWSERENAVQALAA